MLFIGILAEFMPIVEPKIYQKYVIMDKNGQTSLYVKVLKDLYCLLRRALLVYRRIVKYI